MSFGERSVSLLRMPEPDSMIIARRDEIVAALRAIVPGEGVIADEEGLRPYEWDGLTAYRQPPLVIVLPETTKQVSCILDWYQAHGVKVVPRGFGTSLSGGALPLADRRCSVAGPREIQENIGNRL